MFDLTNRHAGLRIGMISERVAQGSMQAVWRN